MELDLHRAQSQDPTEIMLEEHPVSLVSSIKQKMGKTTHFGRICKVSETFYKENEEKYFPTIVSIGPFHHGEEKLKAMKDLKWQYLNTLLLRTLNVESCLAKCIEVLKLLEKRARKCYGEEVCMVSDEFVEMMLLDGCFIIELFLKTCCKGLRRRGDPFLTTYTMFLHLQRDLILLENQIPFFVLQHLFNLVPLPRQCSNSLVELAFRFFKKTIPEDPQDLRGSFGQEIHHLLDLVHQSFIPKTHIFQIHSFNGQQSQAQLQMNNLSVNELLKVGIEIKRASSRCFLDIKFEDGTLRVPTFKNHDLMEIVLRNMIAMENCCYDAKKYVTSYVFLMKNLIQSNDEAKILCKKWILNKGSGKEEEFVTLFGKISVEVDAKDFYYKDLCEKINKFRKVNKTVWYARKVRNSVTICLGEL